MQLKVFTLPTIGGEEINEELNRFLRTNKVIHIERQFYTSSEGAYWTFCVSYLPYSTGVAPLVEKREKIDYKQVLSEEDFAVFSRLRVIRKQLAEQDAVPAYAVFTDAELAEIARLAQINEKSIQTIHGIGAKKAEKYGGQLCELINNDMQTTIGV